MKIIQFKVKKTNKAPIRIPNEKYYYTADDFGITIFMDRSPGFKFKIHGCFIAKEVMIKESGKGILRFVGVNDEPTDPVEHLLWENKYTSRKRLHTIDEIFNGRYKYSKTNDTFITGIIDDNDCFRVRVVPGFISSTTSLIDYLHIVELCFPIKESNIHIILNASTHRWWMRDSQVSLDDTIRLLWMTEMFTVLKEHLDGIK